MEEMRKMILMASTGTIEGIKDVNGYSLNSVGGYSLNSVGDIVDIVGEDGIFGLGRVHDSVNGSGEG
ncbi:hypothetical protein TorRG33x02_348380 [Trema orientale]|uniref:Uncharacterized protein n=1 Tax=Trema orientale TaxID=63057 RepID=A0A2P5AK18_TREOI|nr:hypothetical protein TorRG33x02_348380 [Trema orientale]